MTARQRDAGARACCQIRVHAQDIQATGQAPPATAGEIQSAGGQVGLAVTTFATHQARPVEVQALVQARALVEAQVQVQVQVVQAQPEAQAVLQT